MLRTKRQGFTLIELMVVIVIIGVLSTLAIPRFTAISDKAKMGEAPKIIANFESAYLATQTQYGEVTSSNLMFSLPKSTLFSYTATYGSTDYLTATNLQKIGKHTPNNVAMGTEYTADRSEFKRCINSSDARTMVPNFVSTDGILPTATPCAGGGGGGNAGGNNSDG